MRKGTMFCFLIVCFCVLALGAAPSGAALMADDFAVLRELPVSQDGVLYRAPLTREVYGSLMRSQNLDLAVFNKLGDVVPFTVGHSSPVTADTVSRDLYSLPFFQLPAAKPGEEPLAPLDVFVQTGPDGQVINIKGAESGLKDQTEHRARYLLDLSAVPFNGASVSCALTIALPDDVNITAEATLAHSSNLRDWQPLLAKMPLVQLQNKETRLAADTFELPSVPERYLLLDITCAGGAVPEVLEARLTVERHVSSLVQLENATFDGVLLDDKRTVVYDTKGAYPIARVNFVLAEPGLYSAAFASGPDGKTWRTSASAELSMVMDGTSARRNASFNVQLNEDRYWRLVFEKPFSGPLPQLRISWRLYDLFFFAQGGAPYVLAFGLDSPDLASMRAQELLRDDVLRRGMMSTTIGAVMRRGPRPATPQAVPAGTPLWQKYAVWGLLVLAALVLSLMALKLLRSAKSERRRD